MRILNLALALALALTILACEERKESKTTIEPKTKPVPPAEQNVFVEGATYITECLSGDLEIAGMKIPTSQKTYIEENGKFTRGEFRS